MNTNLLLICLSLVIATGCAPTLTNPGPRNWIEQGNLMPPVATPKVSSHKVTIPPTSYLTPDFKYPSNMLAYVWSLESSTNMTDWVCIASNMYGRPAGRWMNMRQLERAG